MPWSVCLGSGLFLSKCAVLFSIFGCSGYTSMGLIDSDVCPFIQEVDCFSVTLFPAWGRHSMAYVACNAIFLSMLYLVWPHWRVWIRCCVMTEIAFCSVFSIASIFSSELKSTYLSLCAAFFHGLLSAASHHDPGKGLPSFATVAPNYKHREVAARRKQEEETSSRNGPWRWVLRKPIRHTKER